MFKRVSGVKDILPKEIPFWQRVSEVARQVFARYSYQEIRPPLLEEAALFNRSLGQSSEVIQKQMFTIRHHEDLYALRPEGTASVVRAYLENGLDKSRRFAKFFYMGPMFRAERPQKGRLRQFHHIGAEAIGSDDPGLDVELISLADTLLTQFEIHGYSIKINTLGCAKDKEKLCSNLHNSLNDTLEGLCDDCKVRFNQNTLRILDCKREACRKTVASLKVGEAFLCEECDAHFAKVRQGLDTLGISYEVVPTLVRGLDYYTRTVFEISHPGLGAQDALGAGGRYDNLVAELGGTQTPAIGFAFGVERLLLVSGYKPQAMQSCLVYLICLGEEAKSKGIKLLSDLRKEGISCDTDYECKSLKGAMRAANDAQARFVIIFGEDEIKKDCVTLKDMSSGNQKEVALDSLLKEITC